MAKRTDVAVGLDVGGTNLRIGAVTPNGRLLEFRTETFDAGNGSTVGLDRIEAGIRALVSTITRPNLVGIGIGVTGPVDIRLGRVRNPYTLPGWEDVDVVTPLAHAFGVPVRVMNDLEAAALGEHWQGAARGSRCMAMVMFGTGVGVGLVRDGTPYRGAAESHPESGHQVIDPAGPLCYCGSFGCWEQLTSGPAIVRMVSALRDAALEGLDAAGIARAAENGNAHARRVMSHAAWYVGLGLINVVAFYGPDTIVLGGGAALGYVPFLGMIEETMGQSRRFLPPPQIRLVMTTLGDHVGVIGAVTPFFSLRPAAPPLLPIRS